MYKSENDGCMTDENGNKQHWWDECFKINFVKIDQEGINVYIIGVPERGGVDKYVGGKRRSE